MAKLIDSVLAKGETIQYHAYVSSWSLIPLVVAGLVTLPVFGLGILFWVAAAMKYTRTELVITDKAIRARYGIIRRQALDMPLADAERVEIDQSGLGRNFNYGSITIAGKGASYVPITGIDNPDRFRQMFADAKKARKPQPLKAAA